MSGNYIFPIILDHVCDLFLIKSIFLLHIYVGYTNISFSEWLSFNIFCHTFVHFTTVFLTWYDFMSYSIVLSMSISAWVFQHGSIVLGALFTSLLKSHVKFLAYLNYCVI